MSPPLIDPNSVILFAGASVALALLLGLTLGRRRRPDQSIRWLIASNAVLLAAVVGVVARPLIGFELGAALVIGAVYVAICCAYFAVLQAIDRPLPIRPLAAIGLIGLAAQAGASAFVDSAAPLMFTSSLVNSGVTLYMAINVRRLLRSHGVRISRLLTVPFAAMFAGYSLRLVAILIFPETAAPMATTVFIITMLAWSALILELGMMALHERLARRALGEALSRAEAAASAKTRFMRAISHELRTPLNGVLGLSELMKGEAAGPLPAVYRPFAADIHANGGRLLDLVTNLLDIAAGDTDGVEIAEDLVDLREVIERAMSAAAPIAERRGVALSADVAPDAPTHVRGDAARLTQLAANLVTNGAKYAAEGGIAAVRLELGAAGGARVSVVDDGVGMSAEEAETALELFGRVGGVENPENGPGVGLTLARRIALAHGGALAIRRSPQGGALVEVTLPPERNAAVPSSSPVGAVGLMPADAPAAPPPASIAV